MANKRGFLKGVECHEGIIRFIEYMSEGIVVGGHRLSILRLNRGRFVEEFNLIVGLQEGAEAFHAKVFCGRGVYRPWIEVHSISSEITIGNDRLAMKGSPIEKWLLDSLARSLGAGHPLYIEYYWDEETTRQLDRGVPPHLSRLGYELLIRGFTWFKVWYYPEGFAEGGQKLQAEKPLSEEHRIEHVREILEATREFLEKASRGDEYLLRARNRAREVLGVFKLQ